MFKIRTILLHTIIFATLLSFSLLAKAETQTPKNPVVLTVIGDIDQNNRTGFDPTQDYFLNFHKFKFDKAITFDYVMLEELGMQKIRSGYHDWSEAVDIEGPSLMALLKAVGVERPKLVTLTALDGYKVGLDQKLLDAHDWIIGIKRKGRYLGIGDMGPIWVVHEAQSSSGLASRNESALMPWSVFVIEVQQE